jgi:hypothetical protein
LSDRSVLAAGFALYRPDLIGPGRKEKRIFECAKCRFMKTVMVPDPWQSDSMQWLAGELRPPE